MSENNSRPVSPLRARMIEDMTVRNFTADTLTANTSAR